MTRHLIKLSLLQYFTGAKRCNWFCLRHAEPWEQCPCEFERHIGWAVERLNEHEDAVTLTKWLL